MTSPTTPRSLIRRMRAPLAIATGAVLILGACSVGGSSSTASSDTLRVVLPIEPTTLEACDATLSSTGVVVRSNVTEPMIERDPSSGELAPRLATKWEATGDREWTFTLREGVKFSDGSPFDAKAAAFAIDRAVNGKMACDVEGQMFGDADVEVEAADATTLTVTTEEPDPVLPLRLSFIEMGAPTDAAKKVRTPIGTGPYAIKAWDAGTKITLERNKEYWGDAPTYKGVEYQWRSEGTVRAAMVTGDEADLAMSLSADDGAGDLAVDYPNNETVALRFSGDIAPLDDIRVRQAINFAIDKDGIIDSLYKGASKPAAQIVPKGVVGFNEDLKPVEHDLAKAKQLVADAKADGVPTDDPITIVGRSDQFPKIDQMGEILQDQLSQIGLKAELKIVETSTGLQYQVRPFILDEGAIAMIVQHGNQAGDALFSVDPYMTSNGAMSMFGTPEFDAKLKDAATKTGEARQKAYADAFAYEKSDVVQFAFIASMTGVIAKSKAIDYEPNPASGDELRVSDVKPKG